VTVQIDDAGWGCVVGGVLIGAYRVETQEFTRGLVEPSFFQGDAFGLKDYQGEGGVQIDDCFGRLHVLPGEDILCCTGYVLDGVCEWMAAHGYEFKRGKITGPLQDRIEHELLDYLTGLGFPVDYETLTTPYKKGLFWWKQVQWLKGGNINSTRAIPERIALCKTGWETFNFWANYPYQEAKRAAAQFKARRRRSRWSRYNDDEL
jgi:hypothetical protein